jgi:aryl-alcohol dehydrogenase
VPGRAAGGCLRLYELNFGWRAWSSNAMQRSGVRGHFFGQSSFATHALSTGRNLVKVPKNLPLALLAPLGCGLQTGAGTVMNSLAVPAGAGIAVLARGRLSRGLGGAHRELRRSSASTSSRAAQSRRELGATM